MPHAAPRPFTYSIVHTHHIWLKGTRKWNENKSLYYFFQNTALPPNYHYFGCIAVFFPRRRKNQTTPATHTIFIYFAHSFYKLMYSVTFKCTSPSMELSIQLGTFFCVCSNEIRIPRIRKAHCTNYKLIKRKLVHFAGCMHHRLVEHVCVWGGNSKNEAMQWNLANHLKRKMPIK